jgi:hypothetical protein
VQEFTIGLLALIYYFRQCIFQALLPKLFTPLFYLADTPRLGCKWRTLYNSPTTFVKFVKDGWWSHLWLAFLFYAFSSTGASSIISNNFKYWGSSSSSVSSLQPNRCLKTVTQNVSISKLHTKVLYNLQLIGCLLKRKHEYGRIPFVFVYLGYTKVSFRHRNSVTLNVLHRKNPFIKHLFYR